MNETIFDTFPVLETPRLLLRALAPTDAELLLRFNGDVEALRYIAREPYESIDEAREKLASFLASFAEHHALWWAFELRTGDETIGYGGLFGIDSIANNAEIGYGLLRGFSGAGYASEAVLEIKRFGGEDMNLHRIYALVDPDNFASARVLIKAGFSKEGCLRHHSFARGRYFDHDIFAWVDTSPGR